MSLVTGSQRLSVTMVQPPYNSLLSMSIEDKIIESIIAKRYLQFSFEYVEEGVDPEELRELWRSLPYNSLLSMSFIVVCENGVAAFIDVTLQFSFEYVS